MTRPPSRPPSGEPQEPEPARLSRLVAVRETQLSESTRQLQARDQEIQRLRGLVSEREGLLREREGELGRFRAMTEQLDEARATATNLQRDVTTLTGRIQELEASRASAEAARDALTQRLEEQSGELERVRARNDELARVQLEYEGRLSEAVRGALEAQRREHESQLTSVARERDELRRRVEELEGREPAEPSGERKTEPATLASAFAEMLEEVSAREPVAGEQFAVNVTKVEIEARGLLRAPAEEGQQPEFVTPDPEKVDPGMLSTMRMELRVTPLTAHEE